MAKNNDSIVMILSECKLQDLEPIVAQQNGALNSAK